MPLPIRDITLDGPHPPLPIRVHPAEAACPCAGALLWWIHGGAFVGGSLDMPESDAVCRALSEAGVVCVAVGYRLAPRFGDRRAQRAPDAVRFPQPLDDCERAWRWARQNVADLGAEPNRCHVGGASAGGTPAAPLTLRLIRAAGPGECRARLSVPARRIAFAGAQVSPPRARATAAGHLHPGLGALCGPLLRRPRPARTASRGISRRRRSLRLSSHAHRQLRTRHPARFGRALRRGIAGPRPPGAGRLRAGYVPRGLEPTWTNGFRRQHREDCRMAWERLSGRLVPEWDGRRRFGGDVSSTGRRHNTLTVSTETREKFL